MAGADVTAFLFYVAFVASSSFDVGEQWSRIQQALGAGQTVFDMAHRVPQRFLPTALAAAPGGVQPSPLSGVTSGELGLPKLELPKLELRGVHFEYPTRPGASVLRGLDLAVGAGEVVGLVGGSGGGKSTVVRLLRFLTQRLLRGAPDN